MIHWIIFLGIIKKSILFLNKIELNTIYTKIFSREKHSYPSTISNCSFNCKMKSPFFVIIALEDKEESRRIATFCREKGILVNTVDDPQYCDFYFPSLVTRGKCSIGISTSGASPAIAGLLREQIEQVVPEQMEEIMDWMYRKRIELKENFPTEQARKQVLRRKVRQNFL